MSDAPQSEFERTLLGHMLSDADGNVRAPHCCGKPMADDGGCSEGCCDDYKCSDCGKQLRVSYGD